MYKKLVQQRGFTKRIAKITESRVIYKSKLFAKETEVSIAYEDLSRHKDAYLLNRQNYYIPVIVLGLFTALSFILKEDEDFGPKIWIFWGIPFVISAITYLFSIERLWRIRVQNNPSLFFFRNKPSKKEANEFIDALFEARDKYLRETYFLKPNKNLSFESQKDNLQWLRKSEVITGAEFQNSMKKLEEIFNMELQKIGFN